MPSDKYWEMLDGEHPAYVNELVGLINWSHNCSHPTPFALYLDVIGYSEEVMGENICEPKLPNLGYLEMDYFADAIKEFTKAPIDVREWLDELMNQEVGE